MLNPNSRFLDTIEVPEFWKHYSNKDRSLNLVNLEKILKGSLASIPSPSEKIQIMAGKVCFMFKGKTLLGAVNKLLKTKSLLTSPSIPVRIVKT